MKTKAATVKLSAFGEVTLKGKYKEGLIVMIAPTKEYLSPGSDPNFYDVYLPNGTFIATLHDLCLAY